MPTTITSAGVTFNDTTTLTSAKQICKAWVNFNGTGTIGTNQTIRSSYNVSSVAKNGTGDYTVNFATPMADANYSACISRSGGSNGVGILDYSGIRAKTASAYNVVLANTAVNAFVDEAFINIQIFGN
jgi:hypothetical protein